MTAKDVKLYSSDKPKAVIVDNVVNCNYANHSFDKPQQ